MTELENENAKAQEQEPQTNASPNPGGGTQEEKSPSGRVLSEILDWIRILLIAAAGAWLCNHFLIINTQVPSGSMEDTLPKPSRIISSRIHYWFSDPQRGDVILFDPPDGDKYYYVKRVVGLPGETLEIVDGLVYIDGSETPLPEPYLKEAAVGSFGPYKIPEDCYFVMGDNRNHSNDSRYWEHPFVPRKSVHAKAIFGYWPRFFWVN